MWVRDRLVVAGQKKERKQPRAGREMESETKKKREKERVS